MTEEEKKTAAEQKQREMEEMMRQAQESYRQEYTSIPYDGPVYGCRREELMLPMQDGVRLYTEIFKPDGLAQFPVPAAARARARDIGNPTSMSARMAAIPCSGSTTSPGQRASAISEPAIWP